MFSGPYIILELALNQWMQNHSPADCFFIRDDDIDLLQRGSMRESHSPRRLTQVRRFPFCRLSRCLCQGETDDADGFR